MRLVRSRRFWLAVLVVPTGVGISTGGPELTADPERIAKLIRQLGDKRYANREAAGRELEEVGEKALPAVREAISNPDLEVSNRARQTRLGILRRAGLSKTTGLQMVAIDEGRFLMGSSAREPHRRPDETQHAVRITRPFLLGKYEVTQGQYEQVMKANPSYFRAGGGGRKRSRARYDQDAGRTGDLVRRRRVLQQTERAGRVRPVLPARPT